MDFNLNILKIDPAAEVEKICTFINNQLKTVYRRNGIMVGLSGGVDSAVIAALAVEALGQEKVFSLILPEKESNPVSSQFARLQAKSLGIESREIDITPTVESVVSYKWRDEYIKSIIAEYKPGLKYNISLPTDLLDRASFSFYVLQLQLPDGSIKKQRLSIEQFRTITSFANIKIRSRMIHLYAEAERRNLLVAGTTNRTEFILGDFCKYGDGGTDIEALTHLYKDQIYQLAKYLNVVSEIIDRTPSPDTFSLPVSDQEFFFRIPFDKLDYLLYGWEHKIEPSKVAGILKLTTDAVERSYKDFTTKNRATTHLREMPGGLE